MVNKYDYFFVFNNQGFFYLKGIAFGKKAGDLIDSEKVEKTFILKHDETSEKFKLLLEDIPVDYVSISYDIIEYAKNILNVQFNDFIYVTLTDHLNFAIKRHKENISYVNALRWEIKKFYPKSIKFFLQSLAQEADFSSGLSIISPLYTIFYEKSH